MLVALGVTTAAAPSTYTTVPWACLFCRSRLCSAARLHPWLGLEVVYYEFESFTEQFPQTSPQSLFTFEGSRMAMLDISSLTIPTTGDFASDLPILAVHFCLPYASIAGRQEESSLNLACSCPPAIGLFHHLPASRLKHDDVHISVALFSRVRPSLFPALYQNPGGSFFIFGGQWSSDYSSESSRAFSSVAGSLASGCRCWKKGCSKLRIIPRKSFQSANTTLF